MYIIVIRRALIVNGGSHRYIRQKYLVVEREILIEVLYASQINLMNKEVFLNIKAEFNKSSQRV